VDPADTLPEIRERLEAAGFPSERIGAVLQCVEVQEEPAFRDIDRPADTLEAGRELAEGRHAFLEAFENRFEQEWYGEA